jgi:hypothetical protein
MSAAEPRATARRVAEQWTTWRRNGRCTGSLVGGSATVATAWLTHRTQTRREFIRLEMRKREMLYGSSSVLRGFLWMHSRTRSTADPLATVRAHQPIQLAASPPVLVEAERLLTRIADVPEELDAREHALTATPKSADRSGPSAGLPGRAEGDARASQPSRSRQERRRFAHDSDAVSPTLTYIDCDMNTSSPPMKPIGPLRYCRGCRAHASSSGQNAARYRRETRRVLAFALVSCAAPCSNRRWMYRADSQPQRHRSKRRIPPGGTATVTRSSRISSAGPRARTGTSRSRWSACARREPARRSAARGCIRALGFKVPVSITEPGMTRPPSRSYRRRPTRRVGRAASTFREIDIAGRLRACRGGRSRHAQFRGHRTRRSSPGGVGRRRQLLHPGRGAAPA